MPKVNNYIKQKMSGLQEDDGRLIDFYFKPWTVYLNHAIVLATAIFVGMPYWVGVYVPMAMPYYLYPFAAMLGFHVTAVNDYLNWKIYRRIYLLFIWIMSLLSIASLVIYMAEWYYKPPTDLIASPSRFNGTYYSSFMGGTYPPLIINTTSSITAPDGWWIMHIIWATVAIAISFFDLVASGWILVIDLGANYWERLYEDETNPITDVVPVISRVPRVKIRNTKDHLSIRVLKWLAGFFAFYILYTQIVAWVVLAQSSAVINQNQNTLFLITYVLMASIELPLSDLYHSKGWDAIQRSEDGGIDDAKMSGTDGLQAMFEMFYHLDEGEGPNSTAIDETVWNKKTVLIAGHFPMERFAHLPILIGFTVLSIATIAINFVQQNYWLFHGENALPGACSIVSGDVLVLNYTRWSNLTITYSANTTGHADYSLSQISEFTCMDYVGLLVGVIFSGIALFPLFWYMRDGDPWCYGTYRTLHDSIILQHRVKTSKADLDKLFSGNAMNVFVAKYKAFAKNCTDNKDELERVRKLYVTLVPPGKSYENSATWASKTSKVRFSRKVRDDRL